MKKKGKKEILRLSEIVGSLDISQFKGKTKQNNYRKVINTIFHYFFKLKKKDWIKYGQ